MSIEHMTSTEFAKYKLIMAAIKLFGEQGVDSVSLREINREAGHKNNSALHYHFGNKIGLIAAVIEFIQEAFDRERLALLDELENRSEQDSVSPKEITAAFIKPYVAIITQHSWGYNAVRAIARMEFDGNTEVHKLLYKNAAPAMRRLLALTRKALPELPLKVMKQRQNFVLNALIYGFADHKNLHQSYLGNLAVKDLNQLANLYIEMAAAAIAAPHVD